MLRNVDPELRRRIGRQSAFLGGPAGAVILCIYLIATAQIPLWIVPLIIILSVPIGYVAAVAYLLDRPIASIIFAAGTLYLAARLVASVRSAS